MRLCRTAVSFYTKEQINNYRKDLTGMKIFKVIIIMAAIIMATGIGVYLCSQAKETEKTETAVMI